MSFNLHYRSQAIGKSGVIFTCDIYEDGWTGGTETVDPAFNPFLQKYLTESDDAFSPFVASEFELSFDFTDFVGTYPDFVAVADKYYCKIYKPLLDLWQGWVILDSVSTRFNTGRQIVTFGAVDGLAKLKSIPYVPSNLDINVNLTLLNTILSCLNKINSPLGFYVNVCVSVYAGGMLNRGDGSQYEPFSQAYEATRDWLNTDMTYTDCYTVLETICRSWGCQIFQRNNEFVIASVNERFASTIYYTKYDLTGSLISSGSYTIRDTIEPYVDDTTTPKYFINAGQQKITRKGFKEIALKHTYEFAPQHIDNGDLSRMTSGFYTNWGQTTGGAGSSITVTTLPGPIPCISMVAGINPGSIAYVNALSVASGNLDDMPRLSFILSAVANASTPAMFIVIRIYDPANPTNNFALDPNGNWVANGNTYYLVDWPESGQRTVNIDMPPLPISGAFLIAFHLQNGAVGPVPGTLLQVAIARIFLTFTTKKQSQLISANKNASVYKKLQEIPAGQYNSTDITLKGAYVDSAGLELTGWYRYGISENYLSLMRLLLQQYINVFTASQVNMQGDFRSAVDGVLNVQPLISLNITDPTTNSLSVSGRSYILGSSSINYTLDEVSGTFLETRNTDVVATITDEIIYNND